MDAISDPLTHTVVVRSSAQVGKTEILLNTIGYFVAQDPAPILMIQPTLEMGETISKDRVAPMVRDTPDLLDRIIKDDRKNTLLHKAFPGGHLTIAGANSPASLASRPVRVVLLDEVDRYPPSAGAEGDPVTLAKARSKNFLNRKLVLTSTPTIKGVSRIDQAFEESDQRRFWVPCPHCGEYQVLVWRQVRWDAGDWNSARYVCEHCGVAWDNGDRQSAVSAGQWRSAQPFSGIAGFALSELYSPWARLEDMVRAFLDAKHSRSAERMRAWVNTTLGESWEDDGERVDETGLAERAENWEGLPAEVILVTCGVDMQDDRLEVETIGWGAHEESWSLDYRAIYGDPSGPALWQQLEEYLIERTPAAVAIDSGGHHTQAVYAFCRSRYRRRVFAIKGMAGPGRPVWPKHASRSNSGKVNLFMIGVDAAKEQVYSHLKLRTPGPGYCHFPDGRDEHYYAGLVSEVVHVRYSKGFAIREWKRRSGVRNEPLDCRVYAYAALCSLNPNWPRLARKHVKATQETAPEPQPEAPIVAPLPGQLTQRKAIQQPRRGGGFVTGWR